ncbi:uncharacterized protein LOC130635566 isoform X1 [Hydractinia symbiolongicarpus]|uniref:uncharacterized protein LOC130630671 isoform X1 n=1 Tax=Hydractinia symbiolongicarpus TaxID=13093 RepID=UPI00254D05D5|nr:uncharacterized protein LOC130630671 isoform X1 [Hydractinia symbiolongicarpus]XP_057300948.1 uncharacterized protein LOC130635566 isoform X1 [Hydractinia symbiolongicarpus]
MLIAGVLISFFYLNVASSFNPGKRDEEMRRALYLRSESSRSQIEKDQEWNKHNLVMNEFYAARDEVAKRNLRIKQWKDMERMRRMRQPQFFDMTRDGARIKQQESGYFKREIDYVHCMDTCKNEYDPQLKWIFVYCNFRELQLECYCYLSLNINYVYYCVFSFCYCFCY